MRYVTTSNKQDLSDVIDFSWLSLRFHSRVSSFIPQMALLVGTCALVLMHLVLLAKFVPQISTSFSLLVPRMYVL
jgi:hypothetical protein